MTSKLVSIFASVFTPELLAQLEGPLSTLFTAGLSAIPGNAPFSPIETAVIQSVAITAINSAVAKVTPVANAAVGVQPIYPPAVSAALQAGPTQSNVAG